MMYKKTYLGYCIWGVTQSETPISIPLVSFQRNVAKDLNPIGLFCKEGGKRDEEN